MQYLIKFSILIFSMAMLVTTTLDCKPATAHGFGVALLLSPIHFDKKMAQAYRNGFLLATTERDAHPDEHSDGHLGGLDIFLFTIDANANIADQINSIKIENELAIVVAFGSDELYSKIKTILAKSNIALMVPGNAELNVSNSDFTKIFVSGFETLYGFGPDIPSAQGYIAAQRIDIAVRKHGGVDNINLLRHELDKSVMEFTW